MPRASFGPEDLLEVKMMLARGKTPTEIKEKFPKMTDTRISLIKTGRMVVNPNVPAPPPFHPSAVFTDMPKEKLGFASKALLGNARAKKKMGVTKLSVKDLAKAFEK
jgi:hypothetical protein